MSRRQPVLLVAATLAAVGAVGLVVVILLPSTDVVTPGAAIPLATAAADPGDALRLARRVDLPLLALADRVILDEHKPGGECGARVTLTRPEAVAELRRALRPREVPPSGGEPAATLSFYRGSHLMRTVWVIEGGEWGFARPGASHTTGDDPDLWRLIREYLRG
jgi:hypothetical protein